MTDAKRTGALPAHFSPCRDVAARPQQRLSHAPSPCAYSIPQSALFLLLFYSVSERVLHDARVPLRS